MNPVYLSPPTTQIVQLLYERADMGAIITPDSDRPELYRVGKFRMWAADNGCFAAGDRFDPTRYLHWLMGLRAYTATCLFATAPDVVGCHVSTWERSKNWLGALRTIGFPAAFVAQDGFDGSQPIYWDLIDVLFIGGTTDYKLGSDARAAICAAQDRGLSVHVGRVNSRQRYRYFAGLGANSVDGTYVKFGPSTNIKKMTGWVEEPITAIGQLDLFGEAL